MKSTLFSLLLCLVCTVGARGQRINCMNGFDALQQKNYGIALAEFRSLQERNPSVAAYGLALIFGTTREFKDLDSAIFYLESAIETHAASLSSSSRRRRDNLVEIGWEAEHMKALFMGLLREKFQTLKGEKALAGLTELLLKLPATELKDSVLQCRDSLWFNACEVTSRACLMTLQWSSPNSRYLASIQQRINELEFQQWVIHGSELELSSYITYHPRSPFTSLAEDELYQLYLLSNDTIQFKSFIALYPFNRNVDRIWRAYYQLSAGNYDPGRMRSFIDRNPDYPFVELVRDELESFGRALYPYASEDGVLGYMGGQGEVLIPASFDWAGEFLEGLAVVMKGDKYGVINKQGNIHIPIRFDFISDFRQGYAIFELDGTFGVLNRAGITVIQNLYPDLEWVFGDLLVYEVEGQKGLMQITGEPLCTPMFDELNPVNEMLAIASKAGKSGVINSSLTEVIKFQFDRITKIPQGFLVEKNGLKGIYDVMGKEVLAVQYEGIGESKQGFLVLKKGGMFSHVNSQTWRINAMWYTGYENDLKLATFVNGQFLIQKKKAYYWTDTLKRTTKLFAFDQLNAVGEVLAGRKSKAGQFGFWDRNGVELSPFHFDYVEPLSNGQYLVSRAGMSGIYSTSGVPLIPCSYDDIVTWQENTYYMVQIGTKKGIFTLDGREVLPVAYDWIKKFNEQCWMLNKAGELCYYFPETQQWIKHNR